MVLAHTRRARPLSQVRLRGAERARARALEQLTNAVVLCVFLGVIGIGLGFVAALVTRRYRPTLAGGCLAVAILYVLYIVTTGEGAPFVPYAMVAGAVGAAVLFGAYALGVALARALERRLA